MTWAPVFGVAADIVPCPRTVNNRALRHRAAPVAEIAASFDRPTTLLIRSRNSAAALRNPIAADSGLLITMDFKVLGCHGGESKKHQCPAFLIDGRVCLDAGSITNMLTLKEQQKIEAVIVSHAHIDHVRDLAMLTDTRAQQGGPPLTIAATPGTIAELRRHFFNDKLWPDFTKIPDERNRTVVFQKLATEKISEVCGYKVRPIAVDHTVEAAATWSVTARLRSPTAEIRGRPSACGKPSRASANCKRS